LSISKYQTVQSAGRLTKTKLMSHRSHIVPLAAALVLGVPASALAAGPRLEDYNRQAWTVNDGVPAGISSLAQTTDGWLWLGTVGGLYRFDGERFERYQLPGNAPLSRTRVTLVHAERNGDLWIGYTSGGLAVLRKDGRLQDFVDRDSIAMGLVQSIAIDADDSIWVGASNGVYHYIDRAWRPVADMHGVSLSSVTSILLDQYRRLWVNNEKGPYLLDRASGKLASAGRAGLYGSVIASPDGAIWMAERERAQLLAGAPTASTAPSLPREGWSNQMESRWGGQVDRKGNLWALRCQGRECAVLARPIQGPGAPAPALAAAHPDPHGPLSAQVMSSTLEDREGDIWIAGPEGLQRFRENKLLPAGLPTGSGVYSMARDAEGRVWATERDTGQLWRLSGSAEPATMPGFYAVLGNDRDGALLLAGKRTIERRYRGEVSQVALPAGPDGQPRDLTVVGLQDDGKTLWMASLQTGLMGYRDGQWRTRGALKLPQAINLGAVGGAGQLWLSLDDGRLVLWDSGKLQSFDAMRFGLATGIFVGDELLLCGDRGMGVLRGTQLQPLHAADPEVLLNVSGMIVTPDGDRWFNGGKGVVHVRRDDWRAAVTRPDHLLRYQLLDASEGYRGRATLENRLPSAVRDDDGQLWFRGSGGIVRYDPRLAAPNPVAPSVEIVRLDAGTDSYAANADVHLPGGTQAFNIRYTASGLRQPAGMRFRYRLSGIDQQWQDSVGRVAHYTNIGPGSYTFAVRAANEDGVAGAGEASLRLDIAPTLTQTVWFQLACATLACLSLYGLYRYRLKAVATRMARTLAVKMAERERIARTLHDTILQSVQTIILRLHMLSDELPPDSPAQSQLRGWLERADHTLGRGRDQVHELRSSIDGDLVGAIRETGSALAELYPHIRFELNVSGTPQPLPLRLCEEASEIGREALRNAFQHSGAAAIEAALNYDGVQVLLAIKDDGQGIAAQVLSDGQRAGRWGMIGMRERAARVGATLAIDSAAGTGTTVRLALTLPLPGRQRPLSSMLGRLFRRRASLHMPTVADGD
jgi:signal transduction histidine kinase/ligand-binding sensor domain-containing protein